LIISLLSLPVSVPASAVPASTPAPELILKNSPAHYISECKTFIAQKLYEPALFSCYNAYQLGSTDMGAVLYQLGKNNFFDEITSNNLRQEYKSYKGSPEVQRLLLSIRFSSQSNYIAQGSIYGSWCLDKDMNFDAEVRAGEGSSYEGRSFEGYARLVINPSGQYTQASAKIENGRFKYSNNILTLGYPNFGEYQVEILDNNQLALKTKDLKTKELKVEGLGKTQTYSRKSCTKLGLQRFIQVLVNNKSSNNCDDLTNYLGPQLIPAQYLPTEIVNTLKQNPKQNHCLQLIQKISEV
jgi:hypothetical protein